MWRCFVAPGETVVLDGMSACIGRLRLDIKSTGHTEEPSLQQAVQAVASSFGATVDTNCLEVRLVGELPITVEALIHIESRSEGTQ